MRDIFPKNAIDSFDFFPPVTSLATQEVILKLFKFEFFFRKYSQH